MKKFYTITAIAAVVLGLTACDKNEPTKSFKTVSPTVNSPTVESTVQPNTVSAKIDDAKIVTLINTEVVEDADLNVFKINIDSTNGNVVLKGNAPNEMAKERAGSIAKSIEGVVSVDNQLVIGETTSELKQDAIEAKDRVVDAATEAYENTKDKAIELKNDANRSMNDPDSSLNRGVNNIEQKIDDTATNVSVNAGLASDADLSSLKINVDVKNGHVILKGTAPSVAAKRRATEIATNAKGVLSVENQLMVEAN